MSTQPSKDWEGLREICRRLRAPGGCNWDRGQTLETVTPYLLEETHELLDAIGRRDNAATVEELGDLLYLVVFLVTIAEEEKRFGFEDVALGITSKLIRRHPHVFGDSPQVLAPEAVREQWEVIKARERRDHDEAAAEGTPADGTGADGTTADGTGDDGTTADGTGADGTGANGIAADGIAADGTGADGIAADGTMVAGKPGDTTGAEAAAPPSSTRTRLACGAPGLPALLAAYRVQEKAASFGFDWPDLSPVLAKLDEEREELTDALCSEGALASDRDARSHRAEGKQLLEDKPSAGRRVAGPASLHELGDLLFAAVNLARHIGADPEVALRGTIDRFRNRFAGMETILESKGHSLKDADLDTMEQAWQAAKKAETRNLDPTRS